MQIYAKYHLEYIKIVPITGNETIFASQNENGTSLVYVKTILNTITKNNNYLCTVKRIKRTKS